ncbi:MAG: 3-oxoacyl-ACP reductase FabG [Christensenellaceae bacterium]|jgi:3-oxoacyl-[acyl-carrier protein] reductase|nr:3-oxoacyl-ACP reductase FabG [Christensenellaceae bacterium]
MPQNVLITGASRGIGRAAAFAFARAAWRVGVNYHTNRDAAYEVVEAIEDFGGFATALEGDVANPADCAAMVEALQDAYGPLDALINNAGISYVGLFDQTAPADWQRLLDVNLLGARNMSAAVLPAMLSRKRGSIVNTASIWGLNGSSCEVAYSASKAALIGMTQALAQELGPSGIRVNCVAPGVIQTDMNAALSPAELADLAERTALCRIGRPEEVAEAMVFLAGEKAGFITGQTLRVDGGFIG